MTFLFRPFINSVILLAVLALTSCAGIDPEKRKYHFETSLDTYTYGASDRLVPGNYILASITEPSEDAKFIRVRSPYIASMRCAESLEREFNTRGFKRVYNQKNADYIMWFNCERSLISMDDGYVAAPSYRNSTSYGSTNGSISGSDGSQYRISSNTTALGKEISSISLRKQSKGIGSMTATLTILQLSEPYSRKLRYPVWSGSVRWSYREPGVIKFVPFATLVSNLIIGFDSWEGNGNTVGNVFSELPPKKIVNALSQSEIAAFENTGVSEFGYTYALTKDYSSRSVVDITGEKYVPWEVYDFSNKLVTEAVQGGGDYSVYTKTGSSKLVAKCREGKIDFYIESDLITDLDTNQVKLYLFEYDNRKPSAIYEVEKVDQRLGYISSAQSSIWLTEFLNQGQGRVKDQIEFYVKELDSGIVFRNEGFAEAVKIAFPECGSLQ